MYTVYVHMQWWQIGVGIRLKVGELTGKKRIDRDKNSMAPSDHLIHLYFITSS